MYLSGLELRSDLTPHFLTASFLETNVKISHLWEVFLAHNYLQKIYLTEKTRNKESSRHRFALFNFARVVKCNAILLSLFVRWWNGILQMIISNKQGLRWSLALIWWPAVGSFWLRSKSNKYRSQSCLIQSCTYTEYLIQFLLSMLFIATLAAKIVH